MSVSAEVSGTVEPVGVEFRWKIEQFSPKINFNVRTALYSSFFSSSLTKDREIRWRLKMYPGGETEEFKDYIALYLVCCSDHEETTSFSLSVMEKSTNKVHESECMNVAAEFSNGFNWGWQKFLEKKCIIDEGKDILADDTLTISCKLSIPGLQEDGDDYDCDEVNSYYEELLKTGKFSDVTVAVESKILPLHKNILSSCSPVFLAMFDHDMRENNENKVEIADIKGEVALEMFRYIYTWKVNNIDTMADKLFEAADKYAIKGLKKLCEKSLLNALSIDNALKCLMLTTIYETFYLKPKVMEFVLANLKELFVKPEYKQLSMECKDEIIKAMAGIKD